VKTSNKQVLLARTAFLAVTLLLVAWIVDLEGVFSAVKTVPAWLYALLLILALVRVQLTVVRWMLLNPDRSGQLSFWQYFRLTMISKPFNLILPGALGGDFARSVLTWKQVTSHRGQNLIAIMADRFVGLFSILLLGFFALFFIEPIPERHPLWYLLGILLLGFVATTMLAGNQGLIDALRRRFEKWGGMGLLLAKAVLAWNQSVRYFKGHRQRVFAAFLISIPAHAISFYSAYLLAIELGMTISFYDMCAVFSLVWVITAIPVTISGLGVREISLIYLMSLYGVSGELATALSVCVYLIAVMIGCVGIGFIFLAKSNRSEGATDY